MYQWKQKWILYTEQVHNLQLHLNCIFSYGYNICSLGWQWLTASCSAFEGTVLRNVNNFRKNSSNVIFSIFVRYFYESFGKIFIYIFKFPQLLINLQNSTVNIFPYSIPLHYYYARSNSIKWTLQCNALMTSSVRPLNDYIPEYSSSFRWYTNF